MKNSDSTSFKPFSKISKESIIRKLFTRYQIVQRDANKQNWEISRDADHSKISQSLQPNHDARIILSKYYELKYGIKIVNLKDSNDFEKFDSFIRSKKEDKELFKIGVILPAVFFDEMPSISGRTHANPILFERSKDGCLSAINLDCISTLKDQQNLLSKRMMSRADIQINPKNSNLLDVNSCHTYAISILKDALRIDELKAKLLNEKEEIKEETAYNTSIEYTQLPPELLKFTQARSSIEGADLSAPIIRSNLSKDNISLAQRREHESETVFRRLEQDEWELGEDEEVWESKTRNSALWNKSIGNVERIKTVLDYYEIDNEEALDEKVATLYQEQKYGLSNGTILDNILSSLPSSSTKKSSLSQPSSQLILSTESHSNVRK